MNKKIKKICSIFVAVAVAFSPIQYAAAEAVENTILINEINSSPDDWVEIINLGTGEADLSGYEIRDNSDDHRWQFPEGAAVGSGELCVVEGDTVGMVYDDQSGTYVEGTFGSAIGIGSGDSIRIYDKDGTLLDEYSWTEHASYQGDPALASFGRYPDGTGSFVLTKETKGEPNEWYKPQVALNEVESNDSADGNDWAEIYNFGTMTVDISGWYLLDNDPVGHASETTPVADGTVLQPGGFYTFEENKDFTFGLGKNDKATIFNKDGVVIDEFEWTAHAGGVYARIPDGTGDFIDFETPTKGKPNLVINPVVINEVQSNDKDGGPDWIELANPTNEVIDISGIVIKDNDDTHAYTIPEGTNIPANGFLVIDENTFGFGLGKGDSVRLFEGDMLIGSTTWVEHTNPTWGLYPDVNGTEYRNTLEETPGAANKFEGIPDVIDWQGSDTVVIYDEEPTFLEDSSGLDFHNGQLYAVDNGTGRFWILDVAKDGSLSFAEGFENGKRVRFRKDAENPAAPGPDAEGITVDGSGMVYIASERDNSAKGVNYNSILMVNPNLDAEDIVAEKEWDLTASLPQVSANMGIEAVEWVSGDDVNGKLFDKNKSTAFEISNYPDAIANGVFFVALEDNGHAYAYILNNDGTSIQIADIDSKLGGAMAMDYDTYKDILWVVADNGYNNRAAMINFNGTENPEIVHVNPPAGVDVTANNEGFAIAEHVYTKYGQRPVYRFTDGLKSGSLSIGSVSCDYISDYTKPANIRVKLYGYDDIHVTWDKQAVPDDNLKYRVEYKRSTWNNYRELSSGTTDNYYKKANLADGAKYKFRITPFVEEDGVKYEGAPGYSSYIYTLKKIAAPRVSKSSRNYVRVRWNNIPGESGYQIARSRYKTKNFSTVKRVSYKYSTTTAKTLRNRTYYYKIRAYKIVDGKRIYAPWSAVRSYRLR